SYRDSIFSGELNFWSDLSPIKYNAANPNDYVITNIYGTDASCNNPSVTAVQPDLNGQFEYNILNGVNVEIKKDILNVTDVQPVINGFDAFKTRQVLLNDPSYSPSVFAVIAMDVNLDGVVSAGDVSQINQRAVLQIPEFKQAWNYNQQGVSDGRPSKDWLFVDSTVTLATAPYQTYSKSSVPAVPFCLPVPLTDYPDCPLISDEVYKGILVGDVDGSYSTVNGGPNSFKTGSDNKVIFDLAHAVVNSNYVDVPVSITSDDQINALDFAVKYNEANLSFNSVINHNAYMQSLANYNADDQTLRFTSNSMQAYDKNQSLISVRFELNNGQFSAADVNSIAAYLNGKQVETELSGSATGISNNTNVENMISVYPNPVKDMLNVLVAENAIVQLMDAGGRQIFVQTNVYANQKEEINTLGLANGIYILKVYNENFVSTSKVVVNR
ncbi:MAG: T9SS type A sorting domain-containing protein, partial [Bacteroidia bacterium]